MDTGYDFEILESLVGRILTVQDITIGANQDPFIVRYRGRLKIQDSEAAYDQLDSWVKPYNLMPLFREQDGAHAVLLVPRLQQPKPSNPWINLILWILTLLSTIYVGNIMTLGDFPALTLEDLPNFILRGAPYAVSIMAILSAHEFGHYFMARSKGVNVTLPYFIPLPLPPLGTMGAFISMRAIPKNRKQLLDIGLAGPFAGLIVTIPVLILGLFQSEVGRVLPGSLMEGNSILYLFLKWLHFGQLLPSPAHYTMSPVLQWFVFFFTGKPSPVGGLDVMLGPVAWAGIAGLLVTALNLIPAGQLDGGHAIFVLIGRKNAERLRIFIIAALVLLGFFWQGWWLWAAIVFFLGRIYAEPLDMITPVDEKRKNLARLALVIFFLIFVPIPFSGVV